MNARDGRSVTRSSLVNTASHVVLRGSKVRWFTLALLAASATPVAAQVFDVQAGSSSLYRAHGGSVELRSGSSSVALSAGALSSGYAVGGLFKKTTRNLTWSIGDDVLDFRLPTDLFTGNHYVPVRGAGLVARRPRTNVTIFAGATSTGRGSPFFRGATWDEPAALVFADRSIAPGLVAFSRNVLAKRLTSIHGLQWRARPAVTLAADAGVGANRGYASASATVEQSWISAHAAYVSRRAGFRRVLADSPMASEVERESLGITLKPARQWSITAARQHFVQDDAEAVDPARVTVNRISAGVNAVGFRVSGSVYDSSGSRFNNTGASASVGRRVNRIVDASVDYFRSAPRDEAPSSSVVVNVQEAVSPRVSLLQVITRADGRTSFSAGGEFISNPVTVGVSYQTVYAPFHRGNPFVQTLGLDVRVRLMGNIQLRAGTYTTPDGRMRYTISGSHLLHRDRRRSDGASRAAFPKYLIHGIVRDADGDPVEGAAVKIGEEVLLTGRDGRFFLRTGRAAPTEITVLPEEFSLPGRFQAVSAPTIAVPDIESRAQQVVIVVRQR